MLIFECSIPILLSAATNHDDPFFLPHHCLHATRKHGLQAHITNHKHTFFSRPQSGGIANLPRQQKSIAAVRPHCFRETVAQQSPNVAPWPELPIARRYQCRNSTNRKISMPMRQVSACESCGVVMFEVQTGIPPKGFGWCGVSRARDFTA
jgi:hypothetical protein